MSGEIASREAIPLQPISVLIAFGLPVMTTFEAWRAFDKNGLQSC